MVTMIRTYKSKSKHAMWNGICFHAKAEWIDMDSPMNVSWSIDLILKNKQFFFKACRFFALFTDIFDVFVLPFAQISQTCSA